MPHSSGGGSHGGGSHGGSGYHGGGSSRPAIRTSRSYFSGCHSYVYYRHCRPYYVYSDTDLRRQSSNKYRWLTLLFFIPFFIVLAIIFINTLTPPKKITSLESYSCEIIDNLDCIDDKTSLNEQLSIFKEKTGIPVTIITVSKDVWYNNYSSLENYAYDQYVAKFHSNESHWLIIYSYKDVSGFDDWAYEGMQGDDTDSILNENITDEFNNCLDIYLRDSTSTVSDAFSIAFETINKDVMKLNIDFEELFGISIFTLIVIILFIMTLVSLLRNNYDYSELKEVNGKPETVTCAYCRGQYAKGVHTQCPHCGASIIEEPTFDK